MKHERLKHIEDCLICAVESQIGNLQEVDAKELGEVVDMIKDFEEAIYYCTITEAMNSKDKDKHKEPEEEIKYRRMYSIPTMYDKATPEVHMRDYREGRSPYSRRMYMEAKEQHHDKTIHLRELEKYMQELSQDIVDMIQDASPDEKQYLEKKITALASKIGQMK